MAQNYWECRITRAWSTAPLDPGVWYDAVCERGCRCMVAWVTGEENTPENQLRKREEAEDVEMVEVVPGVVVKRLRLSESR